MDRTIGNGNISPIKKISGNITYGIGEGDFSPVYDGDYNITPLAFQEVTLKTKDRKLIEDIVVREIPYYETTNPSGGNTVYIAGQLEFG